MKIRDIVLVVLVSCFAFGCTPDKKEETKPVDQNSADQKSAQKIKAPATVKVEIMPEGGDEATRIHKFDQLGMEYETEIQFRDGGVGTEIRNPLSKAVVEYNRFYKDGKQIKERLKFSSDGKTIVLQERFFRNGVLELKKEKLSDGSLSVVENYESGAEQYHMLLRADGSGEEKRFDDLFDGNPPMLRLSVKWTSAGVVVIEEFDNDSVLDSRSTIKPDGTMKMERFKDGKLAVVQNWRARTPAEQDEARGHFQGPWKMLTMETYDAETEKLFRVFFYDSSTNLASEPRLVHVYLPDGKKAVIEISENSNFSSYKTLDAFGALIEELDASEADMDWIVLPDIMTFSPSFNPSNFADAVRDLFKKP